MKTIFKNTVVAIITLFVVLPVFAQVNLEKLDYKIPGNDKALQDIGLKFVNAMVEGDFDGMKNLMSDDFVIFGANEDSLDREGYIDLWKSYHEGGTNLAVLKGGIYPVEFTNHKSIMQGTWLMVSLLGTWTPKETQKPVYSWGDMKMKVVDGKISLIYNTEDNLSVMMQMGYQLVPPTTASNK